MVKRNVHDDMVRGAAELLAARGVQGTSFSEVLAHTGAPRGSIYHHFPGGKDELVRAATRSVGDGVTVLLDSLDATSPAKVVDAFVDGWRSVLLAGDYERGCVVAASCLGSEATDELRALSGEVFRNWRDALARALIRSGATRRQAEDLAMVCLASVQGALIVGRAEHDDAVFDALERQLRRLATTKGGTRRSSSPTPPGASTAARSGPTVQPDGDHAG
jgi:AcrR family transcriptional regulator